MRVGGTDLSYEVPEGWQYFGDGGRLVLQGPNNEELIVSGFRVEVRGSEAEKASASGRLFQRAVASVDAATSHPELVVTRPLEEESTPAGLKCWTLRAQTTSGDTLFLESIVVTADGVTLITFEAPNTPASGKTYEVFLSSIRANTEGA